MTRSWIWDPLLRKNFFVNINMLFQYSILFQGDGTSCSKNCHSTALSLIPCYVHSLGALVAPPGMSAFLFIIQNPDSQLFLSMVYLNFHSKSWSSSCVVSLFLTWLYFSSQSTLSISHKFWCLMSLFPTTMWGTFWEWKNGRNFHLAFHPAPDFMKICMTSVGA